MQEPNLKLHAGVHEKLCRILERVGTRLEACGSYLISRAGQELAAFVIEEPEDRAGLCSLAAGTLAATESLGQMLGEEHLRRVFQRGVRRSVLLCPVGSVALLLVVLNGSYQDRISSRELERVILLLEDLLDRDTQHGVKPSMGTGLR